MIITLPITVLGLFLQAKRHGSVAGMTQGRSPQRNASPLHPIVGLFLLYFPNYYGVTF